MRLKKIHSCTQYELSSRWLSEPKAGQHFVGSSLGRYSPLPNEPTGILGRSGNSRRPARHGKLRCAPVGNDRCHEGSPAPKAPNEPTGLWPVQIVRVVR
jgi:hypothetical protein